ncbi:vacuolar ATPase assembly integral membrane protein VMA21, partial [Phenoliferia sp. Uapishka_3]
MRRNPNGVPRVPEHMKVAEGQSLEEGEDLTGVLIKLGLFTIAMVVLPIGSYYVSRDYYFGVKNTTPPGIIAALMANILLFGFVWYAMKEDREDARKEAARKKQ